MEELELHAAGAKTMVNWREDGIAHTGLHLPEYRAFERKEDADDAPEGRSRRQAGLISISINIRKREIVEKADLRGIDGFRRGAMLREPFSKVVIVDRIQT